MAKTTTYATVPGLNAALRRLPKEASRTLRDAAQGIASDIAGEAAGNARSMGGLAARVAPSIKAKRDRVPVISMGSTQALDGRSGPRQTIGDVMYVAEFGGYTGLPHKGTIGYFLWPTVRDNSDDMQEAYSAALLDALEAI